MAEQQPNGSGEPEEKQDKKGSGLAAEWGAALTEQGVHDADAIAAHWAAVVDEGDVELDSARGSDRVLNQNEIDNILGFAVENQTGGERSGLKALINSAMISYERLPMLEVVFDRLVRLATTSLRNFTSDNVEVALDSISSVRFGDYLNSIPLPAILGVFKAQEWDNYGIVTIDSGLIYSIIDILLGGGRSGQVTRVEGRPYTTIETNLVSRLVELVLADAEQAFGPLSPVRFSLERLETNPRFATVSRPANTAILVHLRIDMEDRGGKIEILLPYATIEPIREQLLQMFMGEKFGRDPTWEGHLATEIHTSEVDVDAVLFDEQMSLQKVLDLKVGQTILFDATPQDPVVIRCGDVPLTSGVMGRRGNNISVRVTRPLVRPNAPTELRGESRNPRMEAR
jgi:flagellar motor switch protein FliM